MDDGIVPSLGNDSAIGERFKSSLTVGKSRPAIHPSDFLRLVGHCESEPGLNLSPSGSCSTQPGQGQWIPQKQSAVPAVLGANKAGGVLMDDGGSKLRGAGVKDEVEEEGMGGFERWLVEGKGGGGGVGSFGLE